LDVLFGLMAPPALILADPGLFRHTMLFQVPDLLAWRVFLYVSVAIALPTLLIGLWLLGGAGRSWHWLRALVRGALLGSALWSVAIGVRLLPMSLPLLLVAIGLLGLVPFVTGWVLFRNAQRLRQLPGDGLPNKVWLVLGLVAAAGLPLAADALVDHGTQRALERATSEDADTRSRALRTLELLSRFIARDEVHALWHRESAGVRRERLADAFRHIADQPPEGWRAVD
jgi:hypothetical protein